MEEEPLLNSPTQGAAAEEPLLNSPTQGAAAGFTFASKYDNFEWNDEANGVYYIRNVCHLSLGFFLCFTAFNGIQNLSTSTLAGPLGTLAPGVLYIVLTINCLFGPSLVTKLGVRGSLVFGFACICFFGAAYLVAVLLPKSCDGDYCDGANAIRWSLVLTAASLFGFAASPTWVAQGSYMTANAKELSKKWAHRGLIEYDESSSDLPVMGFLNGIFWMILQLTQVTGNVVPAAMQNAGASTSAVFIVYLVFGVLGLLIISLLRPMDVVQKEVDVRRDVSDMLSLWRDPRLCLIIPIILYGGLEMGWVWGDFTATIVKGSIGKKNIGFVMTVFGVSDALFSFVFGKLSDSIGRFSVIIIGCFAQFTVAAMVVFQMSGTFDIIADDDGIPNEGAPGWSTLIMMAALWAVGDAALNTQLNSIISDMFGDQAEAGFANYKLCQSLGVSIAFVFPIIGIEFASRTYVFAIVGVVGVLCLAVLEFCGFKKKHNEPDNDDEHAQGIQSPFRRSTEALRLSA
jgi:MFS family permease